MVTPTLLNRVLPEQFPEHLRDYLTENLSDLNQDKGINYLDQQNKVWNVKVINTSASEENSEMVIRIYSKDCFASQKFQLDNETPQMTFTYLNGSHRFMTSPLTYAPSLRGEEGADDSPDLTTHSNDLIEILGRFTTLRRSSDDTPPLHRRIRSRYDSVSDQVFPPMGPNYPRTLHVNIRNIAALAVIICGALALKNFVHYYRSQPIPSQSRFKGLKPCTLYLTSSVVSLLFVLWSGHIRETPVPFPHKPPPPINIKRSVDRD